MHNFQKNVLFNEEAEAAFLHAIIDDISRFGKLKIIPVQGEFYSEENNKIYDTVIRLSLNEGFNLSALSTSLNVNNEYLSRILETNYDPLCLKLYVSEIKRSSIRRKLQETVNDTIFKINDSNVKNEEIVNSLQGVIFESSTEGQREIYQASDVSSFVYKRLMERNKAVLEGKEPEIGMNTGIKGVDNKTYGIKSGEMWLIGGATSDGKTELMLNIVNNICVENKRSTVIFTQEMTKENLIERLLCLNSSVPFFRIITGDFANEEQEEKIRKAYIKISEAPLYIDDSADLTGNDIFTRISWLKLIEPNLSLVVDDYLQLVLSKRKETREQEVASVSRTFKRIAKHFKLGVLVLSQMNTNIDDRPNELPRLNDIRESKAPTHDSHVVLLLHCPYKFDREKGYDKSVVNLCLAKNRDGETGVIRMNNIAPIQRFEEVL